MKYLNCVCYSLTLALIIVALFLIVKKIKLINENLDNVEVNDQTRDNIFNSLISEDEGKYPIKIFDEVDYKSNKTVATTWNISLEKIDNESAKQLIQLFAFLAPDNISKDMFVQSGEYLPEPLASDIRNELKIDKTIRDLRRYSLIQVNNGQMSIHRLLQDVIRQSLGNNKVEYFNYCVKVLHKLFKYDQHDMKTWEVCSRLMPHIKALFAHEKGLKTETKDIAMKLFVVFVFFISKNNLD